MANEDEDQAAAQHILKIAQERMQNAELTIEDGLQESRVAMLMAQYAAEELQKTPAPDASDGFDRSGEERLGQPDGEPKTGRC